MGSITVNCACTAAGLIMYAKYHDCDLVSAKVNQHNIQSQN